MPYFNQRHAELSLETVEIELLQKGLVVLYEPYFLKYTNSF